MINVLGKFQVKPEFQHQFKKGLLEVVKGSPSEPGCLGIRLFQDKRNPNLFFGFEQFTDEAAVAFHREQSYEIALIEMAEQVLVVPPQAYLLSEGISGMLYPEGANPLSEEELIVIAIFEMKESQRDKMIAQYEKQIPNVRGNDGCISFNAFSVLGEPTQLAVMEHWKTQKVARDFSMTDQLSVETGKILASSLDRPIPEYLHELVELKP